jgi:hypothetical protein
MSDRDILGRVVREAWVRWARAQPDPKPSWLVPYDELSETDKEADRQIAEAVVGHMNERRHRLIEKKSAGTLTPADEAEFVAVQRAFFDILDAVFPRPGPDLARLDAIERRLRGEEEGD